MSAATALRRYQELDLSGRVHGANAHGLVSILYDELLVALDVFRRADGRQRLAHYQRASTVLAALEAGLDLRQGGPLAASLATIYRQMQRRLQHARDGDQGALDEVREGVGDLATAWARIVR